MLLPTGSPRTLLSLPSSLSDPGPFPSAAATRAVATVRVLTSLDKTKPLIASLVCGFLPLSTKVTATRTVMSLTMKTRPRLPASTTAAGKRREWWLLKCVTDGLGSVPLSVN